MPFGQKQPLTQAVPQKSGLGLAQVGGHGDPQELNTFDLEHCLTHFPAVFSMVPFGQTQPSIQTAAQTSGFGLAQVGVHADPQLVYTFEVLVKPVDVDPLLEEWELPKEEKNSGKEQDVKEKSVTKIIIVDFILSFVTIV